MTLRELIDRVGDDENMDLGLFLGWDEITDVQIRTDRVYPYIELLPEGHDDE